MGFTDCRRIFHFGLSGILGIVIVLIFIIFSSTWIFPCFSFLSFSTTESSPFFFSFLNFFSPSLESPLFYFFPTRTWILFFSYFPILFVSRTWILPFLCLIFSLAPEFSSFLYFLFNLLSPAPESFPPLRYFPSWKQLSISNAPTQYLTIILFINRTNYLSILQMLQFNISSLSYL